MTDLDELVYSTNQQRTSTRWLRKPTCGWPSIDRTGKFMTHQVDEDFGMSERSAAVAADDALCAHDHRVLCDQVDRPVRVHLRLNNQRLPLNQGVKPRWIKCDIRLSQNCATNCRGFSSDQRTFFSEHQTHTHTHTHTHTLTSFCFPPINRTLL